MDLLHKRYASPFLLLNGLIRSGRFSAFVDEFLTITHDEEEERTLWEFFLHRVFEGSFEDFRNGLKIDRDNQNMTESDIETTLKETQRILGTFNPETQGGEI